MSQSQPQLNAANQVPITQPKKKAQGSTINKQKKNWLIYNLFIRKEFDECKIFIDHIIREYGETHEFANFLKALIMRMNGNLGGALENLKACHLMNEKNPEFLKHISRTLFISGKHKASIEVANEAIKIAPNDWENYYTKGMAFQHLKEYDKSIESFKKATTITKHDSIFTQIGKIYTLREDFKRAIEVYNEALMYSVENVEILTILGLLHLKLQEHYLAFQYLGNALAINEKDTKSILAVSSIMQDKSDYDSALLRYRVAAALNPNSAQLWNNIGMCFYGKNKFITAVSCLKRALYLDPFEWLISYNLGLVNLAIQQYASAFHFFSVAINLKPNYANSYMFLGISLNKLDDYVNACNAFERALEIDKDHLIYLNYAITMVGRGENNDKAKQLFLDFEKIFQKCPEDTRCGREDILDQRSNLARIFNIDLKPAPQR